MEKTLQLQIRKKIHKLISLNPGLSLSDIAEHIGISVQLADYHLHYLEENDLITVIKEAGYKRFFIKGKIADADKKTLSLLQQKIPLKIITLLLTKKIAKPKEIRNLLEISPSLLTYYLKKMEKYGIISICEVDEKKYYSVINEEMIKRVILHYKSNALFNRFRDTWVSEIPISEKISDEE